MSPPKVLACQKCSRGYISKDQRGQRSPVLLECGHSLCEECVRAVAASQEPLFACPQCQQLACVNVNDLQHDAFINGCLVLKVKPHLSEESLEFVSQKKTKKTLKIPLQIPEKEKCEECGVKRSTLLCPKCEDCRFCEACFTKVHRSSKRLSRHVPRRLAVSGEGDGGASSAPRCCTLHQGRPLEYFCSDDGVAVCSHCSISGEHRGHTVEPLSDMNARRRPELEQAIERARTTFLRLRMASKSLREAPSTEALDPAALLDTIQLHFSQLIGQLQLRQRLLCNQLLAAAQTQRAHVHQLATAAVEDQEAVRRLVVEAEAGLAGGDTTLDLDSLLERLAGAADRPCHVVWAAPDQQASEARFLADKTLLTSIGKHGQLELNLPPPVLLMSESELPLDHVVKDITPEMLADADAVSQSSDSMSSESGPRSPAVAPASSVEVVGVVRASPRLLTSPRPPDSRLAAVFPGRLVPGVPSTPTRGCDPQPQTSSLPPLMDELPNKRVLAYPSQPLKLGPYGQEAVVVTHIRNPSSFYVQRCNQQRTLKELMRRVDMWCRSPDSKRNAHMLTLTKSEPCLSQYSRDGVWYRARILDVYPPSEERGETEYEMFYVDFGNQERVLRSRLRPMTRTLARDPEMALPCTLWDLLPSNSGSDWSAEATRTFAELVRGEPVVMTTIREKDARREVELLKAANRNIATDTQQSVRDHLVFIGLARFVGGPPARAGPAAAACVPGVATAEMPRVEHVPSGDARQFYASEQLRKGVHADVLVSHVESPHVFYVQQLGVHADYLTEMMNDMQKIYSSSRASSLALLNPRKGQVCVAEYTADGRFYRAIIEALVPQAVVDVVYVDYGNRERLPLSAVRKIEDKFMMIPRQAIRCRLADIRPRDPQAGWEDVVRRQFIEATDGAPLKMYIDSVESGEHTVTLYKSRPDADVCINALLARLDAVHGSSPSLRVVEYKKVGYEPAVTREVRSAAASSTGSGGSARRSGATQSCHSSPRVSRPAVPGTSPQQPAPAQQAAAAPAGAPAEDGLCPIQVLVSHCVSPAAFFVQITKEMPTLNKMMLEIQREYGAGGVSSSGYRWKVDDVAVACCTPENLFYRVRVTAVGEAVTDQAEVYLIDYGKTEMVKQSDIAVLLKKFEEHRAFAMKCHLHGIRPAGDSGTWTGFACDTMKRMVARSKQLFLINKWAPSSGEESISSLPCDLEAEDEIVAGALEPIRRIRTSLAGKLMEKGLAFGEARDCVTELTATGERTVPSPRLGGEPAAPSPRRGGEPTVRSPRLGGSVPGSPRPAGVQVSYLESAPPPVECWADDVEETLTLCADTDLQDPAVAEAAEVEEEIPLGGDWATLSGRRAPAAAASAPAPAQPAASGEMGELELSMLENEQAAEAVEEQQPPDDDWLPARVPAETHFQAVPTHVTMAGSIYLHTFPEGKETLDVIRQALLTKYKDSRPRPCDAYWHEGQPCIAKYFLDEKWYRAKVLQVHSEKVSVQFVDYGNTDRVLPAELRKNIYMEHVPIQALHCELHNIMPLAEDGNFTVKTLNFVHSQIVERQCDVEVHHFNAARRRFLISLRLANSGLDVNELLVKMGDARYMTDEEQAAAAGSAEPLLDLMLLRAPYPRLRLPAGAPPLPVLCVAVLSPALVLLQPQQWAGEQPAQLRRFSQQLSAIDDVRQKLDEVAPAQPPLQEVAIGAPCLCQFSEDQAWYRAVILSIEAELVRVQYVDWGNIEEVRASSLRAVPPELREVPALSLLVELYRLTPPDARGWQPEAEAAIEASLFRADVQLWARVKQGQREPPLVELVVYDDLSKTNPTATLAYQQAIDDGVVTLCTARRRQ